MSLQQRFAKGDLEAFEELFRRFQGPVFARTVRLVRDQGIAEDLTVEAFWRAYRSRERFDPERDFGAWIGTIATNLALSHLRRMRPEQELKDEAVMREEADATEQQERVSLVRQALLRLPSRLQVTVTMALLEERSYPEIAEALRVPLGTVKSRVFRAVRILRRELKQLRVLA